MRLERGNLVRITDDEVKIAKFKEEGYKEVKEAIEGKDDDVAKVVEGKDDDVAEVAEGKATVEEMEIVEEKVAETAKEEKIDKEVKEVSGEKKAEEVETAEADKEAEAKKTTGRGRSRANNKK